MENTNAANLTERSCAMIVGILFLVVGIAGIIPAFVSLSGTPSLVTMFGLMPSQRSPQLTMKSSYQAR